ncbi:MAG: leucine-rich repeat domain-containing protein [Bacteroidaceae bacterium]|nr:leucine-rich repeat domain-containing protein [Bacteroidaceae bacterium]
MKRILLSLLALVAIGTGARAQDMTATPLTLEATTEGDITFSVTYQYDHPVVLTPIEYKINDGSWTTYSWPTDEAAIKSGGDWPHTFGNAIHVLVGDKVAFRGNNASYYGNGKGYESHIASTADVYVYGNFMSLIHATDFATNYAITGDWNFAKLFRKEGAQPLDPPVTVTTIKSHPTNDIVLPATSLTNNCYTGLFAGCKGITRAPELPSTTMTVGCYQEMFRGTGLTAVPALPTTVFQEYSFEGGVEHGSIDCYMQMFQDCTSLVTVPSNLLPATKLVHGVYQNMFEGCTSLTSLPALPATDLTGGDQCYTSMFKDCTSLTSVPADYLPAAKLDLMCYAWMFAGCTNLTSLPTLPATDLTGGDQCYTSMFKDCTSLVTVPSNLLPATKLVQGVYQNMFEGCTSLTSLPTLPATDLTGGDQCYAAMFRGCTSLKTPPALPATTLDNQCYAEMFSGCTSLETPPALPATKMTVGCYMYMFEGCTSLTEAPALPTTEFDEYGFDEVTMTEYGSLDCYMSMFEGCTSLTVAPELPVTKLIHGVYQSMFKDCTSLTIAPVLPATKVADAAYYRMFYGCTSLNYVKCLATDISEDGAVDEWMGGVPATGTFVKSAAMDWPAGDSGIPSGWTIQNATEADGDIGATPFTMEAIAAGTFTIINPQGLTIQYKKNDGEWTSSAANPISIAVAAGDKVQFRGNNAAYSNEGMDATHFSSSADCYIYGNIMSLVNATDFGTARELTKSYTFHALFAKNDSYDPNTTIKNHPDKDLMMPATKLTEFCYCGMFEGCQGLTKAPALPATELVTYCYDDMFSGCTGLVEAPRLTATELAMGCYTMMFYGCTSLTTAPDLPAKILPMNCYDSMFSGCSSLNYVKCLATTIFDCATSNWLDGVAATGTFVKMSQMRDWPIGADGIPTGWTVNAATEADGDMGAVALTLEAVADGTITISNPNGLVVHYTWRHGDMTSSASFSDVSKTFDVEAGNKLSLSGNQASWGNVAPGYGFQIKSSADVYVYGNVMSLVKSWDFANVTTLTGTMNFACLFGSDNPADANTTIKNHPTKDLVLGATTLTESCYAFMFGGCQGLTRAPELPATTLAPICYHRMFLNCTGLTTAPELPAPTLSTECYFAMFDGCSNLNYVKCLATDILASGCTDEWLTGVAATGTFIMADGMTGWPTGVSGIPAGWTGAETTATIAANDDGEYNYWATYYNTSTGCVADSYTTVYTAKLNAGNTAVVLTEIADKTIPAGNAVILKSTNPTITLTYEGDTGTLANNDLLGTTAAIATPADTYMLVKGGSGVGFYHWEGTDIPAGRGYLTIAGGGGVKAFYPFSGDEGTTAIEMAENADEARDPVLYDLSGRRVQGNPRSGIYVKNGKKIIIK